MSTVRFNFNTEAEAEAFLCGVTYVNDGSIEIVGTEALEDNTWDAVMEDEDIREGGD